MTNGDFVNGTISDKKSKKVARENGFVSKLTIRFLFESIKYKNM